MFSLRSIKFGDYSIYKELEREGKWQQFVSCMIYESNLMISKGVNDPSEYISFHGMRNWTILMGKLVQEIIYVHSKLMIVDDKYVICGSANINDRSLLGSRDSELAASIEDEEFTDGYMNNKKVKCGNYASSLRKKLFK